MRAAAGDLLGEAQLRAILSDPLSAQPAPRRAHVDVTELPVVLAAQLVSGGLGRRDGRTLATYDEIVLDEGQDYPPLLYRLLARMARPSHLTTLGDLNQGLHGYKGPSSWAQVREALGADEAAERQLSRTYRSTRQITALAAGVARSYSRVGGEVGGVDRAGAEVRVWSGGPPEDRVARAVQTMPEAGHANVAVVTRRSAEVGGWAQALQDRDLDAQAMDSDQARYRGGVVVLPVHYAKGLEFDGAVVVDADAGTYDPAVEYESRLLYVAVTRGLHALALVPDGAPHPLLEQALAAGSARPGW